MSVRYTQILTHERPHVDEIVAVWLLRRFGEARFPGVESATVSFTSARKLGEAGLTPEEHEARGTLLLGIGGGRFDEHPTHESERKADECAATLVARELGVADDPALAKILKFVRAADIQGNASPFDISYVVKLLHSQHPGDPERIIEWALVAIEAKYVEQQRFFSAVKQEFEAKARVEEVVAGERRVRMVVIDSDEDGIHKYARSEHGGRAAVVVQRRSSGNVAVFGDRRAGVDLREAVKLIRLAELAAKGLAPNADEEKLVAEGQLAGVLEWFYHKHGQMLLNGSLTQADVPPTRLSLERIAELVKIGLDPNLVKPLCRSTGRCLGDVCDWYSWQLERCRRLGPAG